MNKLQMDAPYPASLLDQGVQGIIGKPIDRVDGPLKVSGAAPYAAEFDLPVVYGVLISSTIGHGALKHIDDRAALAARGVIGVYTNLDRFIRYPQQGGEETAPKQGVFDIFYRGQPFAVAVGESFEAAREAAQLVRVEYAESEGRFNFDALRDEHEQPPPSGSAPARSAKGDVEAALSTCAVVVDETYYTPSQASAAMEPHATIAAWTDDTLTLYTANQMLASSRKQMADALGLKPDQIRFVSKYVGGGFGSKLGITPECVAAALVARELKRPVKIVMSRPQVFEAVVRRSNTEQRLRLGAERDGKLVAISHETVCSNLQGEDFFEPAGAATAFLYGGENRLISHEIVRLNLTLAGSMRAPGEAVGMLALESAMDELAHKLSIDPIDLRKRNEPARDPMKDIAFSSRKLIDCIEEGARRFGWSRRNPTPGSDRRGEWLIGLGFAAAARGNLIQPSIADVTLTSDGGAVIETDMTDIGTGTYTILAQIAGELLGLPVNRIDVRLGDTSYVPGAGSGGSWGASAAGSAVYLACETLRDDLALAAGCEKGELSLKDGKAHWRGQSADLSSLVGNGLSARGAIKPGASSKSTSQASYGAHFAEVAVNAVTGETRVKRMLGVFAAGRILNEKTARSQCIGGMVFGLGGALTEELVHDGRNGKLVNRDLAEYHLPVHADVPAIEAVFLEERDIIANPLHSKGIGELGISGSGAAIANAVFNACGARIRDFPITLDKILPHLPAV